MKTNFTFAYWTRKLDTTVKTRRCLSLWCEGCHNIRISDHCDVTPRIKPFAIHPLMWGLNACLTI